MKRWGWADASRPGTAPRCRVTRGGWARQPKTCRQTLLPKPPGATSRSSPGFLAQLRLSAGACLSIILPIPHREAVVSFTRDPGKQPPTRTVDVLTSGTMNFDLHFGTSQEH